MKLLNSISILSICVMLLVAGCAESGDNENDMEDAEDLNTAESQMNQNAMQNKSAVAILSATQGNEVEGKVTFTKNGNNVRVKGNINNLSSGMHGFHIHETGDCSASDASSAGGHFNPAGNDHAARTDSVRHMGDLGNIEAGSNGTATVSFTDSIIKYNQIIGKAVVVHSGEDDFTSQPSGAAGSRVACGVIESGSAQSDSTMMNDNTGRNTQGQE